MSLVWQMFWSTNQSRQTSEETREWKHVWWVLGGVVGKGWLTFCTVEYNHAQSFLPFQHSSLMARWKFMPHFPGVLKPHEWGNHWWMGMWDSTVIFRFHFHPAGVISTGNLKQRQPWPRCCTDMRQNFLNGKNSLSIYSQNMYSKCDENPCIWS